MDAANIHLVCLLSTESKQTHVKVKMTAANKPSFNHSVLKIIKAGLKKDDIK